MIQVWKIDKFHNADIMLQKIGYATFQVIISRHGKFYQIWRTFKPQWKKWFRKDPYSGQDKQTITIWMMSAARTTIETLEEQEKSKKEKNIKKNDKTPKSGKYIKRKDKGIGSRGKVDKKSDKEGSVQRAEAEAKVDNS